MLVFVQAFINVLAGALTLVIFVRVILSWIPNARLPFGLGDFVFGASEPILAPIRRAPSVVLRFGACKVAEFSHLVCTT